MKITPMWPAIRIDRWQQHPIDGPFVVDISTEARIKDANGVYKIVLFKEARTVPFVHQLDKEESEAVSNLITAVLAFQLEPEVGMLINCPEDPDQRDESERIKEHELNPIRRAERNKRIMEDYKRMYE